MQNSTPTNNEELSWAEWGLSWLIGDNSAPWYDRYNLRGLDLGKHPIEPEYYVAKVGSQSEPVVSDSSAVTPRDEFKIDSNMPGTRAFNTRIYNSRIDAAAAVKGRSTKGWFVGKIQSGPNKGKFRWMKEGGGLFKPRGKNSGVSKRGGGARRGRGNRSQTTRTGRVGLARAPTNFGAMVKGGSSFDQAAMRGDSTRLKWKYYLGDLIYTTTGTTSFTVNGSNNQGQWYCHPANQAYSGASPATTQASFWSQYKIHKACLRFTTRVSVNTDYAVNWATCDDPEIWRSLSVASSTTTITKAMLLSLPQSGTWNGWLPLYCVNVPVKKSWLYVSNQDGGNALFSYADSAALQRQSYAGTFAFRVEGTLPASDTTISNVFVEFDVSFRRMRPAQNANISVDRVEAAKPMSFSDLDIKLFEKFKLFNESHIDSPINSERSFHTVRDDWKGERPPTVAKLKSSSAK
jgi:hypothetical protein